MLPLRVLIVEDSEDDAALVLRELAYSYAVSARRIETVQALRQALQTATWDVVISDFALPQMSAMDVLRILAESHVDLPCLIVSGTIEEEAAVEAMKAGALDFVTKDRLARLRPAVSREIREATDRARGRAARTALDEAKDRMRFALEAAGVGTWEFDVSSDKVTWSDVLERLHGLPVGGFTGTFDAFIDAIHPDDRQGVRDRIAGSMRDHTESRVEYRVTWPDGSLHWISGVGQPFYDDTGRPVRAAGVGMDITVQKNFEDQVRRAQRMESVGNLAGGIAHDFNNLLTAILGYCDSLLDDLRAGAVPQSLEGDLEQIRSAGQRAASLTSQLLAFSRQQIIQPTVLNINTVVAHMEPLLRRLIGEDVTFSITLAPNLGSAKADAGQLEQVIMNLVANARDAMPTGGRLLIETANVDLKESYARSHITVEAGPHVMLAVSDTGTGMTPDVQTRIFEPFFTTKPKGRGTGLGLAITYGIVKQNRGSIWVYSEPGRGATFKIYLPRVAHAPEKVAAKAQPDDRGGSETVLLVEDDERVRKFASEMLRRRGYAVIEASDAEEAQQVAAGIHGPIHLLLTDVVMPGASGRALAQRLTEHRTLMKVLYMSGYTDTAIVDHGVLAPGVAFLQKPFTPVTLARAVRNVLDAPVLPP